ncbi:MFS transporter [Streptomyces pratens]|uniref:MFS transporter n=1 Tax=Streptomyces pratens TaxID=887456 RepID=A0ABW1M588_9ACTN
MGVNPAAPEEQEAEWPTRMGPWRFVVWFGTVSLLADFVYEGARSISGPLLASLGASALLVGVVTGAGEAAALGLRLVSGPLADRTRRFWGLAISGYALTVVSVPLLGVAGVLCAACVLVVTERVGKAVRSPAKDTLLSHATAATGQGRGFAVHEAMDQIGALVGPLLVAGVLALTGNDYGPALGVLAVPGLAVLLLLFWLRARVPDPGAYEREVEASAATPPVAQDGRLPRAFWTYAGFTAATTTGFATFGVLSYHLVERHLLGVAWVPVLYAAAMAVDAVAALATGWLYDRYGARASRGSGRYCRRLSRLRTRASSRSRVTTARLPRLRRLPLPAGWVRRRWHSRIREPGRITITPATDRRPERRPLTVTTGVRPRRPQRRGPCRRSTGPSTACTSPSGVVAGRTPARSATRSTARAPTPWPSPSSTSGWRSSAWSPASS